MPGSKRTPAQPPSDDLLLAAIDRAERHQGRQGEGVLLVAVKEHLDLPRSGAATLMLRPILERLTHAQLIQAVHLRRAGLWSATEKGRHRLRSLRDAEPLPESPAHRRWRDARAAAENSMNALRLALHEALDEALEMLDTDPTPPSITWQKLAERLSRACRHLGSATYCLTEWPEPHDADTDVERAPERHRGMREIQAWDRR
jgi:hypothetical protein